VWQQIAENMYTGLDPRTGLFEQFQGYFELEDLSLAAFEPRTAPMDVMVGHERIRHTQIVKQADVVMLLYLLGDRFPAHVREANFRYYEPARAMAVSSPPIHAAMAAQLGDVELRGATSVRPPRSISRTEWETRRTAFTRAALGGLWQAIVFGFAGLSLTDEGPRLQPRLPAGWRRLRFTIQWRGLRVPVDLSRDAIATSAVAEVHP
jgi:kojibiose phosphorylase